MPRFTATLTFTNVHTNHVRTVTQPLLNTERWLAVEEAYDNANRLMAIDESLKKYRLVGSEAVLVQSA
jgi:hypothetical protein